MSFLSFVLLRLDEKGFQERPDGTYIWHASLVLLRYLQVGRLLAESKDQISCQSFCLNKTSPFV